MDLQPLTQCGAPLGQWGGAENAIETCQTYCGGGVHVHVHVGCMNHDGRLSLGSHGIHVVSSRYARHGIIRREPLKCL